MSRIRFNWWLLLITLAFVSLFIKLGFWQLHRAEEKRILQQQFTLRLHSQAISLDLLPKNQDWHFYPVTLQGHYDNAHSILLDNKIHDHQVGYEVLTPFIDDKHVSPVLINRGWIPQGRNRQSLPVISSVDGRQEISGWVYVPAGKAFTLGQMSDLRQNWPLRVEIINIPALEKILNKPLFPYVILLSPKADSGFVRDWQPISMPPEKHIGYAVQWFTFALVLIIIFIALNLRRVRSRS